MLTAVVPLRDVARQMGLTVDEVRQHQQELVDAGFLEVIEERPGDVVVVRGLIPGDHR